MKRTPLKRKTPMRRAQVQRKPRKPLPPVSPKRAVLNRQYTKVCEEWRAGHDGRCEMIFATASSVIAGEGILVTISGKECEAMPGARSLRGFTRCPSPAMRQPHHSKGRGPFLCAKETFIGLCLPCHRWVDTHRRQAVALGYFTYVNTHPVTER